MKTAGICVIGDNVLKGFTQDVNANVITRMLYNLGIKVVKLVFVAMSKNDIADTVKLMADSYDIVLTSGGCGLLERAVTYEAIGGLFDQPLALIDAIDNIPSPTCGTVPENAIILHDPLVLQVENVYLFPDNPSHVRASLNKLRTVFLHLSDSIFYNRVLHIDGDDKKLVGVWDQLRRQYGVHIFRSPYIGHNDKPSTEIVMESTNLQTLLKCEALVKENLKKMHISRIYRYNFNFENLSTQLSEKIREAVGVLESCFTRYKITEVFLSFNGGKDCTVLLYLALLVLNKMFNKTKDNELHCVYIQQEDAFDEVEAFTMEMVVGLHLPFMTIKGDIKQALEAVLQQNGRFKAVLMGTRRTDPYSENLKYFHMTDANWPQIMRVSPILDWHYSDIWEFLRELRVHYCHLYDMGYTSLGSSSNTLPNPALKTNHGYYLPAYLLNDGTLERHGRQFKKSIPNKKIH